MRERADHARHRAIAAGDDDQFAAGANRAFDLPAGITRIGCDVRFVDGNPARDQSLMRGHEQPAVARTRVAD
jgi:hypothetical protein